jgi:hypothetical protein
VMQDLGVAYANGTGVKKDMKTAVEVCARPLAPCELLVATQRLLNSFHSFLGAVCRSFFSTTNAPPLWVTSKRSVIWP